MTDPLSRRRFLQLGAAAPVVLTARQTAAGPAAGVEVTAYQDGPQVWVRAGGRVLTCYRAHPTQKYPYFYPLAGPRTGRSLTDESGQPWPHHRSVFLGCDRVNGGNFWQGPAAVGQIVSAGPEFIRTAPNAVEVRDRCDWRLPGQDPILCDDRRFTVTVVSPERWHLDVRVALTARRPVRVERTNHSLFAVRAAADLTPAGGGRLVNAAGQVGEKGTFGAPAGWCDFSGRRGDTVEGIALLDHPGNPWAPCRWFTRDYGFMSPTPFNWVADDGWRLAAGESVVLRYRVVLHAGDATDARLADLYKVWAAS
jgi:hypothetical protein